MLPTVTRHHSLNFWKISPARDYYIYNIKNITLMQILGYIQILEFRIHTCRVFPTLFDCSH